MSVLQTSPGRPLTGRIQLPGDKSISHRAVLFNALAEGQARVTGWLQALDVRATIDCVRGLGVRVDEDDQGLTIHGRAMRLEEPSRVLDCGNSGTSMRLLSGVIASQGLHAVLTGDRHLRKRPMTRVVGPLRMMGARIDGRDHGDKAPLSIRGGALRGVRYHSPIASAQVKSCLMLATLGAQGTLRFKEPTLSRDHTERLFSAMGIELVQGEELVLEGGQVPTAVDVQVPSDISSAAFFLVAASIVPGSELELVGVGLNPTRAGVLDALSQMGADIQVQNRRDVGGEPVADLLVRHTTLHGGRIDGPLIPRLIDEVPVLAVAASFAEGETVVADAAELRVKESDRIAATVAGLRACGVQVEERPDGMVIQGGGFHGGQVDSLGDHRIAMAFAVGGCAGGPTTVLDTDNVATSFPTFASLLEQARG